MRVALLSLFVVAAGVTPAAAASTGTVEVPVDQWSVSLVPAPTYGQPLLRVEIDEGFAWPSADGAEVEYRVDLVRPGGAALRDVGRLRRDERFTVLLLWPDRLAGELAGEVEEADGGVQRVPPAAEDPAELLAAFDRWREIAPRRLPKDELEERLEVGRVEISLVPVVAGRAILRQETRGKRPTASRYSWGRPVWPTLWIEPDRPLEVPAEDLAEARLRSFRDRICGLRAADGSPRYPDLCRRLREMLGPDGRRFHVECRIPAEAGITAGFTDSRGDVTLDGEYLLDGDCSLATVLHELSHQQDQDAGRLERVRELARAEADALDADRRGRQALEDGDLAEAQRQLTRLRDAQARILAVERAAGLEQIGTECRALFATIEAADLFGYPGEGLAWMKENVLGMVGELADLRRMFRLPLTDPTGPLCACFRRIDTWVTGQPDVDGNFDRQTVPGTTIKASALIDRLTTVYCGG